ncbi:MAG: hypothetical protein KDC87_10980 [Planctomycetes bacterium]|nr:hypothetical protein [Planctomycetota bacterium]
MLSNRIPSAATLLIILTSCAPGPDPSVRSNARESGSEERDERTGAVQALAWRRLGMVDERGRIPHDAEMRAQAGMRALVTDGTSAGLDSTGWEQLGPGNVGGRIRAIAIHPTQTNIMFVGGVSGGIWRSADSGASWRAVDDAMDNLAITSIVFDPSNSNTLYAATGEGFGNADSIRGAGVFKSTDGGTSWSRLASTNTSNFYWVNRLTISSTGGVLLAATRDGIWRSSDGGSSWTRSSSQPSFDVKFHPGKSGVAVAHSDSRANGKYTTDGGVTWNDCIGLATSNSRRIEFAWHAGYSARGNGAVYALMDAKANLSVLYRSLDGGANFVEVSRHNLLGEQGHYDNTLWVDPSDTDASPGNDVVVAGGIQLWRSTNGGAQFTAISTGALGTPHVDHHTIVAHPKFNGTTIKTVYFGNDGGIWRTNDVYTASIAGGWADLNNSLGITQFYGGSTHFGSGVLVGGAQDNSTLQRTNSSGPNGWAFAYHSDGGFCASDPTDSRYHYAETQNGGLARSVNSGVVFLPLRDFSGDSPNFIAPFILDPNDANRLLFGGSNLWRSNNVKSATPGWSAIWKPPVSTPITAIAVARGNANLLWVGQDKGRVYKSINGTAGAPTFTAVGSSVLPGRYVHRIVVDEKDPDHVFVTLGGFAADNVWETTDGGSRWAPLPGLPAAPVRDIEIHPLHRNWLYAATEVGLLVSENGGQTWSSGASPANVSIDETFFAGAQTLYLVTHGRGMFRQATQGGPTELTTLYYRFDEGAGDATRNYGENPLASSVYRGSATKQAWAYPGRFGTAMLRGSSNTSSSDVSYCDTGWRGPILGDFSLHWYMKERFDPGTAVSDLFGGMGNLRCFTNGSAGGDLVLRGWGQSDLLMPRVGASLQVRARAGVSVGLVVQGSTRQAQWYVDGVPHGAPVSIAGGANVPGALSTFKIGKHLSDTTSCVYDLDEFHYEPHAVSANQIKAWSLGPNTFHFKFDRGDGDLAINYGLHRGDGKMVWPSRGIPPWAAPGRFGPAKLRGTLIAASSDYAYCDTGWRGPLVGDFTLHWWMKERFDPALLQTDLFGGLGSFHCYLQQANLVLQDMNGTHALLFPQNVTPVRDRARAKDGVCIGVTVHARTGLAQWYADGQPVGSPVPVPRGGADVPAAFGSFVIGRHVANTQSCGYDIDEFRLENRVVSGEEIASWCESKAAAGKFGGACGIDLGWLGGRPTIGNALYAHTITADNPVLTHFLFVIGVQRVGPFDMGIAFSGLSGCTWYPAFDIQIPSLRTGVDGRAVIPGAVTTDPTVAGTHVDIQVLGFQGLRLETPLQSNATSHVIEIR